MFKLKKSSRKTIIQAEVEFDEDFKFNLNETPESDAINYVLKQRFQRTLKTAKTLGEHIEYVHDCVEETLKLSNTSVTLKDLGLLHHNYRSQVQTLFQQLAAASV